MVPRRRFTVRRQGDGHIVVEDVGSGEQVRVAGLEEIGGQIGRWLAAEEQATGKTPPEMSKES